VSRTITRAKIGEPEPFLFDNLANRKWDFGAELRAAVSPAAIFRDFDRPFLRWQLGNWVS
jgi:hypothetical protein